MGTSVLVVTFSLKLQDYHVPLYTYYRNSMSDDWRIKIERYVCPSPYTITYGPHALLDTVDKNRITRR